MAFFSSDVLASRRTWITYHPKNSSYNRIESLVCREGVGDMTYGTWSETEPSVRIDTVDDLYRFVDFVEAKVERPTAVSIAAHGYCVDLLVGYVKSFVHLSPDDPDQPYFVTVGNSSDDSVEFWLHSWHHTEVEGRHLVEKALAHAAFREFFRSGELSPAIEWEQYTA
jgi:hypothetical protein